MFKLGKNKRRVVTVETNDKSLAGRAWTGLSYFRQHLRLCVRQALRTKEGGYLYPEDAELVVYELVEVSRHPVSSIQTQILLEEA